MTEINYNQLGAAILPVMVVWVRITAFLAFVPFFNSTRNVAIMFKTAFGFLLSILLVGALPVSSWQLPTKALSYVTVLAGEALTGILIALVVMILVMALQILGHIMGFQMAFSMARMIDATMGEQSNVISVFLVTIGTMIFISIGGDHLVLLSLQKSFEIVPPGQLTVGQDFIDLLVKWINRMFELGVKVAFPGIILLLAVDLTLGLIGRTASKMQIFFVGLPLKITLGLYTLVVGTGFIITVWGREASQLPQWLGRFFGLLRA